MVERDALHVKSRIKEIGDEEYSVKLSVANWNVEDLSSRKKALEKILGSMEDLKGLLVFSDVDLLYKISTDNFQSLDILTIEPYTREKLINLLSKILETITSSSPSTI
jgi:hypothetical protein